MAKTKESEYPFVPKNINDVDPGEFWGIALSNGKFACGRVIQVTDDEGYINDKEQILVGLEDWCGNHLPTSEDIAGKKILKQLIVNTKSIKKTGGNILGFRDLKKDKIKPDLFVSPSVYDPDNSQVFNGLFEFRKATKADYKKYEALGSWGFLQIKYFAEDYFVKGEEVI